MASLFVIQGPDQGKRFNLAQVCVSLGRDTTNTIRLNDTEVSRQHAEIRQDDVGDGYHVVDLNSSNGTFINDARRDRHELQSGDRLKIGATLMIFTGTDVNVSHNTDNVELISSMNQGEKSRIVKSLRHDGQFDKEEEGVSPWLARARSNLQVMYRTSLAVSHTLDIDELLLRIMELIFEWVEADRGCILLTDRDTSALEPKVRHNRPGTPDEEKLSISKTITDYVMSNSEGVLTSDASEDERFDAARSIVTMGVREAIAVPMQGRYGIVGLIYIDTYTAPGKTLRGMSPKFNEEHLKLMVAIGHQAALAVEDTSYYSAMVQAERLAAIGQTIAGLSHSVKNILQGIRGGSYLIEEGLKASETDLIQKGWGIVERNQEKISRLVLDMLTYSKEREPEMAPADLCQVVGEVIELMNSRATELNVTLKWEPVAELPSFVFDSTSMHHAILNVVTNAIDACDEVENGIVEVTVEYDVDEKLISTVVKDNGKGISEQDLARVFVVFESTKGNRGTGLGLPVTQKIAQEHGGEITAESKPGKGSTFRLTWPAVLAEEFNEALVGEKRE